MSSRQGPVVHKFGGSVLADAAAFRRVSAIVHSEQQSGAFQHGALLVISACAGVTDRLLAIAQAAAAGKAEQAEQELQALEQQHLGLVTELGLDRGELQEYVRRLCAELAELCRGIAYLGELTLRTRDAVLGYGELLASAIVAELLRRELPVPVHLVDARRVLLTDYHFGSATPMIGESGYLLQKEGVAEVLQRGEVVVTQGFIGATPSGIPTTLGRGGSDYSAAAFARALEARELQLWKDVPGICTADPRRFPEAQPVAEISYAELQELARFGSKVVHPHAISPAVSGEIPVRIRSVFAPQQPGTLVWHRRYDAPAQPLALAWRERCMAFRWYPKGKLPAGGDARNSGHGAQGAGAVRRCSIAGLGPARHRSLHGHPGGALREGQLSAAPVCAGVHCGERAKPLDVGSPGASPQQRCRLRGVDGRLSGCALRAAGGIRSAISSGGVTRMDSPHARTAAPSPIAARRSLSADD
jgi:aspartate kinase